jgi:RNA polymerase sigma factor (sigma-70 family)
MTETDESLMRAVAAGDLDLLGCLFDRRHGAVHSLCYRLVGSADAADDLTQEVFLRVLRFRHSYRGEASFRTWLYRITYNVCMNYRRRVRATPEVRADAALYHGASEPPRDSEIDATVEAGLAALSPQERTVLVLSRYEGLTYTEIAAVLGSTPGAIRVRAHRALRALRARLEQS